MWSKNVRKLDKCHSRFVSTCYRKSSVLERQPRIASISLASFVAVNAENDQRLRYQTREAKRSWCIFYLFFLLLPNQTRCCSVWTNLLVLISLSWIITEQKPISIWEILSPNIFVRSLGAIIKLIYSAGIFYEILNKIKAFLWDILTNCGESF